MAKHADKHAEKKTNAMRELDTSGQPYQAHWFECPEALSGVEVAHLLKEDPAFHNIVLDDSEEIPIAAQGAFHLAMKDLQTH